MKTQLFYAFAFLLTVFALKVSAQDMTSKIDDIRKEYIALNQEDDFDKAEKRRNQLEKDVMALGPEGKERDKLMKILETDYLNEKIDIDWQNMCNRILKKWGWLSKEEKETMDEFLKVDLFSKDFSDGSPDTAMTIGWVIIKPLMNIWKSYSKSKPTKEEIKGRIIKCLIAILLKPEIKALKPLFSILRDSNESDFHRKILEELIFAVSWDDPDFIDASKKATIEEVKKEAELIAGFVKNSGKSSIRTAAATILGYLKSKEATAILVKGLDDSKIKVKEACLRSIERITGKTFLSQNITRASEAKVWDKAYTKAYKSIQSWFASAKSKLPPQFQ